MPQHQHHCHVLGIKGKKRKKNPQPLHKAKYPSLKRDVGKLYCRDPRPPNCRGINQKLLNNFITSISEINRHDDPCMWETVFKIKYEDYELESDEKMILSRNNIKDNCILTCSSSSMIEVPGTIDQSKSDNWLRAKWPLITASDSKVARNIGYKLTSGITQIPITQISNFINRKLWNRKATLLSNDML